MSTQRTKLSTTFILGAGCSVAYGYPSGEGLLRETLERILRLKKDLYDTLSNRVKFCGVETVDDLTLSCSHFSERQSLVEGVLRAVGFSENEEKLVPEKGKDVYGLLLKWLVFDNTKVITFNYDRVLDERIRRHDLHLGAKGPKIGWTQGSTPDSLIRRDPPILRIRGALIPSPLYTNRTEMERAVENDDTPGREGLSSHVSLFYG